MGWPCAQVWGLLFQRLQSARTPKFVRGFLSFLAGFILRHGASATAASLTPCRAGFFRAACWRRRACLFLARLLCLCSP